MRRKKPQINNELMDSAAAFARFFAASNIEENLENLGPFRNVGFQVFMLKGIWKHNPLICVQIYTLQLFRNNYVVAS